METINVTAETKEKFEVMRFEKRLEDKKNNTQDSFINTLMDFFKKFKNKVKK